jgi:hypothetical protein
MVFIAALIFSRIDSTEGLTSEGAAPRNQPLAA